MLILKISLVLNIIAFLLSLLIMRKVKKRSTESVESMIASLILVIAILSLFYSINKDKEEIVERKEDKIQNTKIEQRVDSIFAIIKSLSIDNDTLGSITKNYKEILKTGIYNFDTLTTPVIPPTTINRKDNVADVEVSIDSCSIIGDRLICFMTYDYVGDQQSKKIVFRANKNIITDNTGKRYNSLKHSIANIESDKIRLHRYELIRGITVRGQIEFLISDVNIQRIALSTVSRHHFYNIPVSN